MKQSVVEIRKWVQIISNDYMHFNEEEIEYVVSLAKAMDFEVIGEDEGVIGWITIKDFDCKKKLNVVILYCRPEKRGCYIRYMLKRIEEIAKQEGAEEIIIGRSISGYKENKFNQALIYFGYTNSSYSKRI